MSSNRSYLETLNTGRQRRPRTAIEDLNRTLDDLESRFAPPRTEREDHHGSSGADMRSRRARRLASGTSMERGYGDDPEMRGYRREPAVQPRPYPWEQDRRGREANADIAGELKALREELHRQISGDLGQEFETLRHKIDTLSTRQGSAGGHELMAELERLSDSIHTMANRSDDRGIGMLRLELEQVRETLSELAREDTVRSMDERWQSLQHRAAGAKADPAVEALAERLDKINDAVNALPESLSLRSLEDKVRTLAGAVESFADGRHASGDDQKLESLEARLDEISRAIAAASSGPLDHGPLERIEARIAALTEQIGEGDSLPNELFDRLNQLSDRIEDVARRASLPERAIEDLAGHVADIAAKLESGVSGHRDGAIIDSLERRFSELANLLEERQLHAAAEGKALFSELDRRLEDLTARFATQPAGAGSDPELLRALDEKFADLSERIDSRPVQSPGLTADLERRLAEISSRLDSSSGKVSDIDPKLIRSLESQVADLTAHLSRPAHATEGLDSLAPRLDDIEKSLADQRDAIISAARAAAENAVRTLGTDGIPDEDAAALAGDLKTLEGLFRKSDDRNSRTFEAIHDTLLKVVDRLGALETRPARTAESKISVASAPPIAPEAFEPAQEEPAPAVPAGKASLLGGLTRNNRSPAEAAAEAAEAAVKSSPRDEEPASAGKKSMLGGLARALTGRKADVEHATSDKKRVSEPVMSNEASLDEPLDASAEDKPLDPGSGAPNLNAIMKRVRDERAQGASKADPGAAKADFIAAARRAAQAAAAEADSFKRGSEKGGSSRKFGAGEFLRAKRKPILMAAAAIMMALAGLQLGKAFFGGGEMTAADGTSADGLPPLVASAPSEPEELTVDTMDEPAAPVRVIDNASEAPARADMTPEPATEIADEGEDATVTDGEMALADPMEAVPATAEPMVEAMETSYEPAPVEAGPIALREAADSGDPRAMFEIGSRYADGRGVTADLAKAATWYERAAEMGLAPAQYRIGNLYEKGVGVERDLGKAKTWYQMAADQGNASAMHNLAVLFAMGGDGVRDNDSAARWFVRAAELGVKDSQFNLGILSAKGLGVPQSLEESYKWFALVAKAGDKDAASKRDEVAKALRPEQLAKARAATDLWKPKPVVEEANTVDIPETWRESEATTAGIDMKQAIRNIQAILNKNGYDAGPADGIMGDRTKTAIAQFQNDNGMDATGEIDEPLVRALLEKK